MSETPTSLLLQSGSPLELAERFEALPVKAGSVLEATVSAASATELKFTLAGEAAAEATGDPATFPVLSEGDTVKVYVQDHTEAGIIVRGDKVEALALWDRMVQLLKQRSRQSSTSVVM